MPDIVEDLRDLHKQATTERSHYYVAKCCERAIDEIETLRAIISNAANNLTAAAKRYRS